MPGRCAAPPAAAMITSRPRSRRPLRIRPSNPASGAPIRCGTHGELPAPASVSLVCSHRLPIRLAAHDHADQWRSGLDANRAAAAGSSPKNPFLPSNVYRFSVLMKSIPACRRSIKQSDNLVVRHELARFRRYETAAPVIGAERFVETAGIHLRAAIADQLTASVRRRSTVSTFLPNSCGIALRPVDRTRPRRPALSSPGPAFGTLCATVLFRRFRVSGGF